MKKANVIIITATVDTSTGLIHLGINYPSWYFRKCFEYSAVSYTHLDVYKRQLSVSSKSFYKRNNALILIKSISNKYKLKQHM